MLKCRFCPLKWQFWRLQLGRCPSTVLRVALGRALIYEGNETVLGTDPNRTHDQPKPYLETAETVLDLYSDKDMFPFLLRGAHKKNSLKIDAFPFSNRTRNRTRTAAVQCQFSREKEKETKKKRKHQKIRVSRKSSPSCAFDIGQAPLQKCIGDFCCTSFGGFCRGFSWRIFLCTFFKQNWGEEIRQQNPRPNPAAQKLQKKRSAKNRT